jgi:hypothetical protein
MASAVLTPWSVVTAAEGKVLAMILAGTALGLSAGGGEPAVWFSCRPGRRCHPAMYDFRQRATAEA